MESITSELQIAPGKPTLVIDASGGGGRLVAMCIALSGADSGEVAHLLFGAAAKATEAEYTRIARAGGLTVIARPPGALSDADEVARVATGKAMVLVEGLRTGIAGGDPWMALATLEHVSLETGCSFVCLMSSRAPELLDSFGCVLEVVEAEATRPVRAFPVRQTQRPQGVLAGAAPTYLVVEQDGDTLSCDFNQEGAGGAERMRLAADADAMLESLLDHPGRVLPQLDGVTYDRCARAVEHLIGTGQVTTAPSNYGALICHPSSKAVEQRASLDRKVYETIAAYPDIAESSLPARCELPAGSIADALRRITHRIRIGSNAGERSFTTEAVAVEREQAVAVLQVIKQSRKLTIEAAAEAVGCALRVAEPVFEQQVKLGDLALLGNGVYEWSTAEERVVRKVVLAAKKGIPLHEIAEESGAPDEVIEDVVSVLLAEGAIVAELKSGAVYYARADRKRVA